VTTTYETRMYENVR